MPRLAELWQFRSAYEALGDEGNELFEWFVDALLERSGIASRHRRDVARSATLRFALEPVGELLIGFEGASYEPPWDGTLDGARRIILDVLPDLAGQVKSDRGRLHGRHPRDD